MRIGCFEPLPGWAGGGEGRGWSGSGRGFVPSGACCCCGFSILHVVTSISVCISSPAKWSPE